MAARLLIIGREASMDRHDEAKDTHTQEPDEIRSGDVLGLGGSPVPKMPGDPSASDDPESVARRRDRLRGEEAEETGTAREDPYKQSPGATGIDMGAGGRGTDISGR